MSPDSLTGSNSRDHLTSGPLSRDPLTSEQLSRQSIFKTVDTLHICKRLSIWKSTTLSLTKNLDYYCISFLQVQTKDTQLIKILFIQRPFSLWTFIKRPIDLRTFVSRSVCYNKCTCFFKGHSITFCCITICCSFFLCP